MAAEKIKSGSEIVNEFLEEVGSDPSMDSAVAEALTRLHRDRRLTQTKLIQELEAKRKAALGHD